jgi:hypothetical protein
MSNTIQIEVNGDAQAYLKTLSDPSRVLRALQRTTDRENKITVGHIQKYYMSLPSDGPTAPDGLRVKSNRLRGSLRANPAGFNEDGLVSSIGSNVVYAGILERGGTTKPHVIEAKNGRALFFNGIFRRRVKHPGSRIEGRHYVENGIRDRLPDYTRAFGKTIAKLK